MINFTNSNCEWYEITGKTIFPIVYSVLMPIYFILGIIGHTFCLIIYYQNAKREKAYWYQILVTVSETLEILFYMLAAVVSAHLSGKHGPGERWFMSSHFLMWCAAHVTEPLANSFVALSLLLSIAMVIDRIFAVLTPIEHKAANHNMIRIWVITLSLAIAFLSGSLDVFRENVVSVNADPRLYKLKRNKDFFEKDLVIFLSHARNTARCIFVAVLIVSNVLLVCFFRKHTLKWPKLACNTIEAKRQRSEKNLLILSVSQSILISLSNFSLITVHWLLYASFDLFVCVAPVWLPILDCMFQLCTIFNFYIFLLLSKHFRNTLSSCLRKSRRSSKVENINGIELSSRSTRNGGTMSTR